MGREFQRRWVLPPPRGPSGAAAGSPTPRPGRACAPAGGGEERLFRVAEGIIHPRGLAPVRTPGRRETQVTDPRALGGWLRTVLGLPPAEAWPRPLLPPWGGWTEGRPACQTGLTAVTCQVSTCFPSIPYPLPLGMQTFLHRRVLEFFLPWEVLG